MLIDASSYDNLDANKQHQRLLSQPKCFENFDNDTGCMLEEMRKLFGWTIDKVPFRRDIERCRTNVAKCWIKKLRAFKLEEAAAPISIEL